MGADTSSQKEWHVDPAVAFETESYKLLKGIWSDGTKISVFGAKNGQNNTDSLMHLSKMLRTLRHPCIIKHVQSCKLHGGFYLLTEDVVPLEVLLLKQEINLVEIIAGLHDVLSALDFLHNKCCIRHNNVNTSSIFVAANGSWKLGGFEDASKYNDKDPIHTYDMFAFGELATHLLNAPGCDTPNNVNGEVEQFLDRIKEECLNTDDSKRITSKELCSDSLFRNDFLDIKTFLQNLILKPEEEKVEFFQSLNKRLSAFSSPMIANHVLPLVWSRLVFLEPSAKKHFLPCLLRPKQGKNNSGSGLLPPDLYKTHLVPKLIKILHVHDHQVRLLLMDHFSYYAHLFSKEELNEVVLPEVLLGVRDSSDDIVASSLRSLASLVHLLGAKVVIGQNNQPIFTDNRPNKSQTEKTKEQQHQHIHQKENLPSTTLPPQLNSEQTHTFVSTSQILNGGEGTSQESRSPTLNIPERSSPDGGESAEDETWSDWEDEKGPTLEPPSHLDTNFIKKLENDDDTISATETSVKDDVSSSKANAKSAHTLPLNGLGEEFDIMALDIKMLKNDKIDDYFSDMEPKLSPAYTHELYDAKANELSSETKKPQTLFSVLSNDTEQECAGWDDSELQVDW